MSPEVERGPLCICKILILKHVLGRKMFMILCPIFIISEIT